MSATQFSSRRRNVYSACSNRSRRSIAHAGFTLIELLVVMTIIGILVAMLLPAVQTVRRSAWEGAQATELAQIDGSVESFRDKYGFYPSDFSEFLAVAGDSSGKAEGRALDFTDTIDVLGITVERRLKQIVLKLSNVNNEDAIEPLDTGAPPRTRLHYWWDTVGMQLASNFGGTGADTYFRRSRGPQVALWFWMTQVFNDAQYPLTGARDATNPLLVTSERNLIHGFSPGSLEVITSVTYPTLNGSGDYKIIRPLQQNSDGPLVYFHHQTYALAGIDFDYNYDATAAGEFSDNFAAAMIVRPDSDGDVTTTEFFKPNSFQIIGAGWAESFGNYNLDTNGDPDDIERIPHGAADGLVFNECSGNLTNFGEGRTDAFLDNVNTNVNN